MSNRKFSIITVCYNSEKTIERTIKSVIQQTCQDFEYIIVDGASTDRTMDIVRRYQQRYPEKFVVISEPDEGIYDAMNKGIQVATGDLIGIVNSDDYYELDALQKMEEACGGQPYEIIYGMLRTIKDGREVSVYIKNHAWLDVDMITHPTCFVSRKIYEDFGVYSLQYRYSADYEFMLRMIRNERIMFKPVYSIISNFSIDGASASVKGYMDTLRLKHAYGLIGENEFKLRMLKSKLVNALKR